FPDGQRNIVDSFHIGIRRRRVVGPHILDVHLLLLPLQRPYTRRRRGLNISSMLDCSNNNEKAISVRNKAGGMKAHQAPVRTDSHNSAHCSIMPSETLPLGPNPNMLRVASVRIPLLSCST